VDRSQALLIGRAEFLFDAEQPLQQGSRLQFGFQFYDSVHKARLLGKPTARLSRGRPASDVPSASSERQRGEVASGVPAQLARLRHSDEGRLHVLQTNAEPCLVLAQRLHRLN